MKRTAVVGITNSCPLMGTRPQTRALWRSGLTQQNYGYSMGITTEMAL
jgi:hypothetical protein